MSKETTTIEVATVTSHTTAVAEAATTSEINLTLSGLEATSNLNDVTDHDLRNESGLIQVMNLVHRHHTHTHTHIHCKKGRVTLTRYGYLSCK